jgi:RNA polymerase sigma-70 factor (ECF subfamily)
MASGRHTPPSPQDEGAPGVFRYFRRHVRQVEERAASLQRRDDIARDDPWRVWLDRHGPALALLARQWCATRADAEDAVQDGFVRFWRSRGRARDDAAYLYACVRSAAVDLSRGRRRRERHEANAGGPDAAGPDASLFESSVDRAELRDAVEHALATLPPEQREVLVMKIWGGLTFAQIAESLSVPPNTAASRYRYALARLEAALPKEVAND